MVTMEKVLLPPQTHPMRVAGVHRVCLGGQ